MSRLPLCTLLVFAAATEAPCTPYWIAWEGDSLPESGGIWQRQYGNWDGAGRGEAIRTIQNGILTIDSLHDDGIYDFLRMDSPGAYSLDPGESFVAQWRVRVNESVGFIPLDVGLALFSDDDWGLGLQFGVDSVRSSFERLQFSYAPGVFHSFELETSDFRAYRLYMDGSLLIDGNFWEPAVTSSYIAWGDGVQGVTSHSEWDYVRFGVIPEPQSVAGAIVLLLLYRRMRRH